MRASISLKLITVYSSKSTYSTLQTLPILTIVFMNICEVNNHIAGSEKSLPTSIKEKEPLWYRVP